MNLTGPALLLLGSLFLASANAAIIAQYDASAGNPAGAGDVQSPNTQGWSDFDGSLGGSDIQEGVIDGGQPGWRNRDGIDNNNPGYFFVLSNANYQDMFDNGWRLTMTIRLVEGGHFFSWGGDNTNTGGNFNFPGDRRAGFGLSASGDSYSISPTGTGGSAITITDGILNSTFIRVVAEGAAGNATGYTVSVFHDDTNAQIGATQNITAYGTGNTSSDDNVAWQSGSSSGDNRESIVRSYTLESIPEPSSSVLLIFTGLTLLSRRKR